MPNARPPIGAGKRAKTQIPGTTLVEVLRVEMARGWQMPDGQSLFEELVALVSQERREKEIRQARFSRMGNEARWGRGRREKQRAATEAWYARNKKARPDPSVGERLEDRLVRAMEPGCWYADRDLCTLIGVPKNYPVQDNARRRWGYLVKKRNPEWRGVVRLPQVQEPKYLYGLSEAGLRRRELLGLLD